MNWAAPACCRPTRFLAMLSPCTHASHSRIECEDPLHGERQTLTLVHRHEADVQHGRICVLAPVGSALGGLSVGQRIDWRTPDGRDLRMRAAAVHDQPTAAGDIPRRAR